MPYKPARSPQGTVKLVKKGEKPEYKFPVKTKGEARAAMARLNQAKPPLPRAIKQHVAREAKRKLGHDTEAIRRILGGE